MAKRQLPEGYDVERSFGRTTPLGPAGAWRRTATCSSIRSGKADVVTDRIDHVADRDPAGLRCPPGRRHHRHTQTGLKLQLFGGATISRNGGPWIRGQRLAYRALMLEGLPMPRSPSATSTRPDVEADLVSQYVCRLLNYADENGYNTVEPVSPGADVERLRSPTRAPAASPAR